MVTVLKPIGESTVFQQGIDLEVVTCFIEYKKKILVLQRGRKDGQYKLWGIPGGKSENNEAPRQTLLREIFEESGIIIPEESFEFLDKAYSLNKYDGSYILHLYYVKLNREPSVIINTKEHLNYLWVSIEDFKSLDLLVSQGLAFELVYNKLKEKISRKLPSLSRKRAK